MEEPTAVELQIMATKTGKGLELQRPTKTFSDTLDFLASDTLDFLAKIRVRRIPWHPSLLFQ